MTFVPGSTVLSNMSENSSSCCAPSMPSNSRLPAIAAEMRAFCQATDRPTLANLIEQGETPVLPPAALQEIGFSLAAYPMTLLSAAIKAMQDALAGFKTGEHPKDLLDFATLRDVVGFNAYYAEEDRYRSE